MTVAKLIQLLEELPADSEVTDVCGNPISEVCFEPDDEDLERVNVWLDTDYIFDQPTQ